MNKKDSDDQMKRGLRDFRNLFFVVVPASFLVAGILRHIILQVF